jgi:hypothetical protein
MVVNTKNKIPKFSFTILFLFLGLLIVFSTAKGHSHYPAIWGSTYPTSNTLDASCLICHSDNSETLNAYGRDICLDNSDDFSTRLASVESLDSDGDGTTNLTEIMNNAQPGWTEGDNRLYHSKTCVDALVNVTVPSSVPRPYDPEFNFFIFLPFITNTIH